MLLFASNRRLMQCALLEYALAMTWRFNGQAVLALAWRMHAEECISKVPSRSLQIDLQIDPLSCLENNMVLGHSCLIDRIYYVCIYIYIYKFVIYLYIYIRSLSWFVLMCICMYVCMYVYIYIYIYIHTYTHVCVYVIYIYIYVYMGCLISSANQT